MRSATALVFYACPVCGKQCDSQIIIDRNLKKTDKPCKVDKMNGQTIGFADHCCDECAKYKDKVVFLIGIDPSKSEMNSMQGIYRTGKVAGIAKESEFIKNNDKFIVTLPDNTKFMFMEDEAGRKIGVWK